MVLQDRDLSAGVKKELVDCRNVAMSKISRVLDTYFQRDQFPHPNQTIRSGPGQFLDASDSLMDASDDKTPLDWLRLCEVGSTALVSDGLTK